MKTVFAGKEVAHIWAKQSQSEGRNSGSSMFFEGKDIFSYGRHFCMARLMPNNVVLITNRGYSNTTAKHLSWTRYAVNHMERIYCAYPNGSVLDNLESIKNRLKSEFDTLNNSRVRPNTKNAAKISIQGIIEQSLRYFEVMGTNEKAVLKISLDGFEMYWKAGKTLDVAGLNEAKDKAAKDKARKEKAAAKKREKEFAERVDKWLNGERVDIYILSMMLN